MDDKDIYVPIETPKPRSRDQWTDVVDGLGGPIVAYFILVPLIGSAIWGIVYVIAWFLN